MRLHTGPCAVTPHHLIWKLLILTEMVLSGKFSLYWCVAKLENVHFLKWQQWNQSMNLVVDRFGFSQCRREVALVVVYSWLWNPKVSLGCMRLQQGRICALQTEGVWQNWTIRCGWLPERVWSPWLWSFWHPLSLWCPPLTAICWCWAVCSCSLVR